MANKVKKQIVKISTGLLMLVEDYRIEKQAFLANVARLPLTLDINWCIEQLILGGLESNHEYTLKRLGLKQET